MIQIQGNRSQSGPSSIRRFACLGALIMCGITGTAAAQAPVTYGFSTDPLGFFAGCPACSFGGQSVTGSFVYDPESPLTGTSPTGLSIYLGGISNWSGTVGSHSFSDDLGIVVVGDEFIGGSRDLLRFSAGLFLNGFDVDGPHPSFGTFTLVDVRMLWVEGVPGNPAGLPDFLTGQSLPINLPDLPGQLILDFVNPLFPEVEQFSVSFNNLVVTPALTSVAVDIKPDTNPNSVNPNSSQKIPVAILTTDTFDAVQVDPLSVTFGVLPAIEAHSRGHIEDVDEDGDADLLLHFNTQDTDISCSDTEIWLFGETFDGESITGSDMINTVGCK